MRLVQHDELPMTSSFTIEEETVVGTDKQVFQHRVVGEQDVGRRAPHVLAKYEFSGQAALGARGGVAPIVPGVFRCLANVLPECRLELGCCIVQVFADFAKALALVVRKCVHGVQDHGPYTWLFQFSCEVLAIQFKEDWIEEAFGLATGGAGGDHHVLTVDVRGADSVLLMFIQSALNQRGCNILGVVREAFRCQLTRIQTFLKAAMWFRKGAFQQATLFAKSVLE